MRHRPSVALGIAALSVISMLAAPSVVAAATTTTRTAEAAVQEDALPSTRLVLARFTGVVGPGSVAPDASAPDRILIRVLVEHTGADDLLDVDVVVESYRRLTTRSLLRQALDEGLVTSPRRVVSAPVREDGPVAPGDVAAVDLFVDVDQIADANTSGVYPVQISLRRGTDVLDHVVTAVVHLAESPANPLSTVALWPIDAAPTGIADAPDDDLVAAIASGGRLDDLVEALAPLETGIVPAVSAHLLDALVLHAGHAVEGDAAPEDDDRDEQERAFDEDAVRFLARIREVLAASSLAPVTDPYAEADLSALVEAGPVLAAIGGELAADGVRRFEALAGVTPDAGALWTTSPVTPTSLDLLRREHLLLPWEAVSLAPPQEGTEIPSPLRELRAASGAVQTASIADPWLTQAMEMPDLRHGTPVAVQRVMAETALAHFESPGIANRPLLLLPPRDWNPGGRVARDLAASLTSAPWLELVGPSAHAALVDDPGITELSARTDRISTDLVGAVSDALSDLAGIRSSLPTGVTALGGRPIESLEAQLLRATSHWFVTQPSTARAMVDDVTNAIDEAYGLVQIPTATGFTLLGEKQEIPITINRPSGDDLELQVEVRSPGALSWPSGDTQPARLRAGQRQTLSFDVEARARGDFGVDVIVRDASGARILAEATIRVRSTFISRRALAIVAGVILLLLIARLRRRPRGPEGDDTSTEQPAGGGTRPRDRARR